jgi:hypothetical protein
MPTQQTQQAAAPKLPSGPGPVAAFTQPLGIGLLIALTFLLTYLAALHKPEPHHLPVGVVAPPEVVAQLQRSLSTPTGDAVALRPVADATAARHQVERGQLVAAYLPIQDGQVDRLLLAGAQGAVVTQTVTGIVTHAATQGRGRRLQVDDVVPLSAADPRGFSGFYVVFGITLAGFIFGQTSHTYSRRLPLGRRLIQALLFAVLTGLAGALVAGPLLGVLPGPLLALAGILVLLALATGLVTMALTALLGDPGIVVATLLLVILGNATSGGVVAASFLPGGFRQLSPVLPAGAATQALSRVDYFDPGGALGPVVVLAAWALGGLLLMAVRGRRRRDRSPSQPIRPVSPHSHDRPRRPRAISLAASSRTPAEESDS